MYEWIISLFKFTINYADCVSTKWNPLKELEKRMLDLFSFRESLFAQLNHSNETEVFNYLDTLNQHADFSKLEQYSSKLNQLNGINKREVHFWRDYFFEYLY